MNIILCEDSDFRKHLNPLTLTRPIGSLRVGILTIKEKWEQRLKARVSFDTEEYLTPKFARIETNDNYFVNSSFLPTRALISLIDKLQEGQVIVSGFEVVAYRGEEKLPSEDLAKASKIFELEPADSRTIKHLPDLFVNNGDEIREDFEYITAGRKSAGIGDPHTRVYAENRVFVEEGVQVKAAIINAEDGPIYIGKNAVVQEGAIILGPSSIGPEGKVAYGAKIRNNVTIGPACRVGGEVGNSIFYACSNKAHDGFLGNSYIGEWCNLGANTNVSNLKNDYGIVKLFDYLTDEMTSTDEVFVGTFMGDYSKVGISTMFNTGSVVGVSCNVFGAGFQSKIIRSFTWGGAAEGYEPYRFEKAIEVINATMSRRKTELTEEETEILMFIKKRHRNAV